LKTKRRAMQDKKNDKVNAPNAKPDAQRRVVDGKK
jgi:hypothetical protein